MFNVKGSSRSTLNFEPETMNLPGRDLQNFRFLGSVAMIGARVNFELFHHRTAELGFREHAFDGELDHLFGLLLEHLLDARFPKAARIKRVASVKLLVVLRAGEDGLFSVDHYDVVAHIKERGPRGVVLAGDD